MANETEPQENQENHSQQTKHIKGYRKKGLVSEQVLLERLSDLSMDENIINPVITLSSVENDDDDDSPMDQDAPKSGKKGTLKKSISLVVPSSFDMSDEPKRPPL